MNAAIFGSIFAFFAIINVISIWKTIKTSPGKIPEEKDWDMLMDDNEEDREEDEENETGLKQE